MARRKRNLAAGAALVVLVVAAMLSAFASAGTDLATSSHSLRDVAGSVTAGDFHSCGVQSNRTVACWGRNGDGQATAPGGTFVDVSAGDAYSCATRTNGAVGCWGKNDQNQASPPTGNFRQLTTGGAHACGVKTDGTAVCWGSNGNGRSTVPAYTWRQLSAGASHTCGIRTDGLVVCWGDDSQGQATPESSTLFTQISSGGSHTCGVRSTGTVGCWGSNGSGESTPPPGRFLQVASGTAHTCGITESGTLSCWGSNASGQRSPPSGTFTAVAAGGSHSCAVRTAGSTVCWGANGDHQSTPPAGTFNSRALDAGFFTTCGIRTDGVVACWGDNSFGQASPPAGTFRQISVGLADSCGIKSDGTVSCWGNGYPGGTPPLTPPSGSFRQVRVSAAGGVGGHTFACGIKTDGSLSCWGDPLGATTPPTAFHYIDLAVGQTHACAVTADGRVGCWGDNSQGQRTAPTTGAYLEVSAEDYTNGAAFTSCALRADGAAICWGDNSQGQASPPAGPYTQLDLGSWFGCALRGDGGATCWGRNDSGEATPPSGAFIGVTAGDTHACGARLDGSVTCWGGNDSGELGGTAPLFTSSAAPGGVVGQAYRHAFTASGLAVNNYTVATGALPPGLALDSATGILSGTPLTAGTYTGTINVTNGFFYPDARQSFAITVLQARTVSIGDRDVREGSSGSTVVSFPITLSAPVPAGQTVSMTASTADVTATAGSDYTAKSTTVSWTAADPLTKNVDVLVAGDTVKEGTESFRVSLSSLIGAAASDSAATGTILDDDGRFYLRVADTAVTEGNSGTVLAQFKVTLSAAPAAGQTVTVHAATTGDTATAGSDFTPFTTDLTWVPGDSLSKYVKVTVPGDTAVEPNERFYLDLSAPGGYASISDSRGIATIVNDD